MTVQEQNMEEYQKLQYEYLAEAEEMFGQKIDYAYNGLSYHYSHPQTILCDSYFLTGEKAFIIKLHGQAINDRKDGIFQLSHEVIHLLSPVEQKEGDEVNYLEEGMATFFARLITIRETGDYNFCDQAISKIPEYLKAYNLYVSLIKINPEAVKELRKHNPVIANIQPEDFDKAKLHVNDQLIHELLTKFERTSQT